LQAIIGIFCIWLASRLLGAVARYFRQPAIIGELLAGILLGPSLIGHYYSFPSPLLDTLDVVAGALFLLTAGWEIRLTDILKFRRVGLAVSAAGAVVPLLIGYGLGTYYAVAVGYDGQGSPQMFACFAPPTVARNRPRTRSTPPACISRSASRFFQVATIRNGSMSPIPTASYASPTIPAI